MYCGREGDEAAPRQRPSGASGARVHVHGRRELPGNSPMTLMDSVKAVPCRRIPVDPSGRPNDIRRSVNLNCPGIAIAVFDMHMDR